MAKSTGLTVPGCSSIRLMATCPSRHVPRAAGRGFADAEGSFRATLIGKELTCIYEFSGNRAVANKNAVDNPHIKMPVNHSTGPNSRHALGRTRFP
jgi:hypothetical protein